MKSDCLPLWGLITDQPTCPQSFWRINQSVFIRLPNLPASAAVRRSRLTDEGGKQNFDEDGTSITPPIHFGIYHYSNEGSATWYEFAKAIVDLSWLDCEVKPIKTEDYPTPAERPMFSLLNKEKIRRNFQFTINHWSNSLKISLENS